MEQEKGLLEPCRVLDLADERGILCGKILGDLGADVIKIENPATGDLSRSQTIGRRTGNSIISDIDYAAENHNRNKRSMTLDLSQEGGRKILDKLLNADLFFSKPLRSFFFKHYISARLNGLDTHLRAVFPGCLCFFHFHATHYFNSYLFC